MQYLITVIDPEHGLGNGTERHITDRLTELVDLFGRMPGIVATIETHEQVVYGITCDDCGQLLTVYGNGDGTGDPVHVFCDLCTEAEHPDDLTTDWNGETGNHLSCEARVPRDTYADGEVEPCDECDGQRWPVEVHAPHCSLFGVDT